MTTRKKWLTARIVVAMLAILAVTIGPYIRVKENLFGESTTAAGRSSDVTGTVTVDGDNVTAATFDLRMKGFHSPQSRHDGQFNGRIMSVDQFPTSKFVPSQLAPGTSVEDSGSLEVELELELVKS